MKLKKKSPSRRKYEQNNPTVSCRVNRDIYERLRKIRELEGLRFADVLKIGLGIIEPKAKDYNRIRNEEYTEGYVEGWNHGHRDAEMAYKITFPCCGCGRIIEVDNKPLREAAGKSMKKAGWGHLECIYQD